MPRLVSITANGSEGEFLKGIEHIISEGRPYISLAAIKGKGYEAHMHGLAGC